MGITSGIEPEVDYPILQTFCHHGWMGDSTCKRIFLAQATCLYFIASSPKLENTETALPNPLVKHFPVLVCINVLNSVPKTVTYRQESHPSNMEKNLLKLGTRTSAEVGIPTPTFSKASCKLQRTSCTYKISSSISKYTIRTARK